MSYKEKTTVPEIIEEIKDFSLEGLKKVKTSTLKLKKEDKTWMEKELDILINNEESQKTQGEEISSIVSKVKSKKFQNKPEVKHIFSLPKEQKERTLELIKLKGTMAASDYVIDKYMGADKISIRDYVLELSKSI